MSQVDERLLFKCHAKRDRLIRELWEVLNNMYNIGGSDNLTDEDLNLWTDVTCHSGNQNKLNQKKEEALKIKGWK